MDKFRARQLISKNKLIARKISKTILKNIRNDENYDQSLNSLVSENDYNKIKEQYKEKVAYLKHKKIKISPRNLPFLYMVKDINKNFEWKINNPSTISNNNIDLVTYGFNVEGLTPSLSSSLFSLVNKNLHKDLNYPEFLEKNQTVKSIMVELFKNVNFATNLSKINISFLKCIEKALEDKHINILTPLCPDYANVDLGKGFYTLTFDGLGSEIGVTAKRLLENLDALHAVFEKRKIEVNHIAAIGDFEALSDDTCKRVNLTQSEFIEKLKISQDRLKIRAGKKLNTILFTELCDGFDNWTKIHSKFFKMLINNEFGNTNLTLDTIKIICEARKPLLYRWFGRISDEEILKVVLWQGAEYATMGNIVRYNLDNTLIIGADHFKMAPFYDLGSTKLPVLYLTSNYMRN